MIPDSLDFIRRGIDEQQAEYAAAHKTPAPAEEAEAEAGAGTDERGAESARALGHEAGNETSGQPPSAMRADTSPRWSAVDDDTSDLLSLVADEGPFPVDEWPYFLGVLKKVADEHDGLIDQNLTRPMLRGQIRPARTGSFFHRAARMGLIRADGWNESDDREQRNGGKPIRLWRWLGATS